LLVRQISALVAATADVVAGYSSQPVFEAEHHLYKLLEVNCADKARMIEALGPLQAKVEET
jgi:hypothetical protein